MLEKSFTKEEWPKALRELQSSYRLFVPVKEGDFHIFRILDESRAPDFSHQNTRLSAKGIVYPQSERMFECSLDESQEGANIYKEAEKDYTPQAIVGIRPCDAQAFKLVKKNFDNAEYRDPCQSCFCTSVGGGPFKEEDLDVLVYDLDGQFAAKAVTEKGERFLEKTAGGKPLGAEERERMEELKRSSSRKVSSQVRTDKLKAKPVNRLFDAPFWEEVAFPCINCGTCTFLCPTCWCFDIQDEVMGKVGDRIRNWDSCMLPLFTLHGSGHNPREKKFQRVRQRFMHKLKYYVDKYDEGIQCSGCGRCVRYCPVNVDIREVAQLMNGY
jgi:sulfhydrogenase subunit beta (sulfur reductase)